MTSSAQDNEHPKQPDTESLGAPQSEASEHSPSDVTTLVEVLARYEQAGYEAQMSVTEQAQVRCFACRTDSPPAMVNLSSLRRLEGASDPADMLAVAAVECPHCASKGLLVLGYGPDSTAEESQVLLALDDRRSEDDGVPPSSAPGEASRT